MSIYSATASNVSVSSTANDIMTLTGVSNVRLQIVEFSVAGMGTTSAAANIGLFNITTAGVTSGGTIAVAAFDPYAVATATTVSNAWTTQPVIGAVPIIALSVNTNGGIYRWVARPGEEIYSIGSSAVGTKTFLGFSIRALTAPSQPYTISVVWVEHPF